MYAEYYKIPVNRDKKYVTLILVTIQPVKVRSLIPLRNEYSRRVARRVVTKN